MNILSRETVYFAKDLKISIVQFGKNEYELAVLYKNWDNWEIDYSVFNDVLKAESSMEVYGTIQYIVGEYADKYENMEIIY